MAYKQKFDGKEEPFFERNLLVFNDKINLFEINNETFFYYFFRIYKKQKRAKLKLYI
jgi:hypothetical protein